MSFEGLIRKDVRNDRNDGTSRAGRVMGIEKHFDVPFVASLAMKEKQIQQNVRPYIAVHKWFARRPGTLFRGLLLSEFASPPLREAYYRGQNLSGIRIADPFMGGGTPLLEANRVGCDVVGFDINPMSCWIVGREIEEIDLPSYDRFAGGVAQSLERELGDLYRTRCPICGEETRVKYFLWVKVGRCESCGAENDLFPGTLIAQDVRHTTNLFYCPVCGGLHEAEDRRNPGNCAHCGTPLGPFQESRKGFCCTRCGEEIPYPRPEEGPPRHRLFAMEYHCSCRGSRRGRLFKVPDREDLRRYTEAESLLDEMTPQWIPDDPIPSGDETDRLHRWGYRHYREMFNARQLLGLERIAREIARVPEERIRRALATNLSDLLRYQNMLCRYDSMALKSLDIFSIHGFPVGWIQCESNLLGIVSGTGKNVGSGGWSNIVGKYRAAKRYCAKPFEVYYFESGSKKEVPVEGERISDSVPGEKGRRVPKVSLHCGNSGEAHIEPGTLDGVFTDPPYYGNVQYAELMDFCYVWLRRFFGEGPIGELFIHSSTRNAQEFTVNKTLGKGIEHFTEGMSQVFRAMVRGLKPGAPFAFTYHHNRVEAYFPLAVAMLDAGLVCSAVFPCPAEMGGSIHINGTGSSIVDSVFLCRTRGKTSRRSIVRDSVGVADLVRIDAERLLLGGLKPTQGDIRCMAQGHLIRLAVWWLREIWNIRESTERRIERLSDFLSEMGGVEAVLEALGGIYAKSADRQSWRVGQPVLEGEDEDELPF